MPVQRYSCYLYLLVLAVFLSSAVSQQDPACPNLKRSRKLQEARLSSLKGSDIVVEGTYLGKEKHFRFAVSRAWELNHGGLQELDEISVSAALPSDASIQSCYNGLKENERYVLIVEAISGGLYQALAPPVSAKKHNHKQNVWKKLCATSEGQCRLQVSPDSFPSEIRVSKQSNTLLRCMVQSVTPLTKIVWLKDDIDIELQGGELYASNGITVYDENLKNGYKNLVVYDAKTLHSGEYTCVATNENGETDSRSTRLKVVPLSEKTSIPCPPGNGGFCMNGGTCRSFLGDQLYCECKPGFSGKRCRDPVSAIPRSAVQDNLLLQDKVQSLTSTVIVMAVGMAICALFLVVFGVSYYRLKGSKSKSSELNTPTHSNDTQVSSLATDAETTVSLLENEVDSRVPHRNNNVLDRKETVASIKSHGNHSVINIEVPSTDSPRASPRPRLKAERR